MFVLTIFMFADMWSKHCHRVITQLQLINIIIIIIIFAYSQTFLIWLGWLDLTSSVAK